MKNCRILYVEDDQTLSFVTRENLERAGYLIEHCDNGITAMEKIRNERFSLYILDVMLPGIDGYSLARKIREKDDAAPILFLSAKSTRDDRIFGLQIGADDYITKPFSIEELILKIEVFLKRSKVENGPGMENEPILIGKYRFYPDRYQMEIGQKPVDLTHREAELIHFLSRNMGKIVKRDDIMNAVWGNDQFYSSRSLDVFISRLRKVFRDDPSIRIENIHNIGYRMSFLIDNQ